MPCLHCDIADLLVASIHDSDFEDLIEQAFIEAGLVGRRLSWLICG